MSRFMYWITRVLIVAITRLPSAERIPKYLQIKYFDKSN